MSCGIANYTEVDIQAIYNWWGDETGPYNLLDNPDGEGLCVCVHVIFYPWRLTPDSPCGPVQEDAGTTPTVEVEALVEEIEVLEEVQALRTRPFTVWQVDCNDEGHLEFIFVYPYKDNNWLTIYDMVGSEVYKEDISYSNPRTVVDLPDGMYTVKTFHLEGHIIQEFMVGLPCGVAAEGAAELPRTGADYLLYMIGAAILIAGLASMLFAFRKRIFKRSAK